MLRFLVLKGLRILDVGSGRGDVLHGLEPCEGVWVDLRAGMIEQARWKYPISRFRHGLLPGCMVLHPVRELEFIFRYKGRTLFLSDDHI